MTRYVWIAAVAVVALIVEAAIACALVEFRDVDPCWAQ